VPSDLTSELAVEAAHLGFDLVGVCAPEPSAAAVAAYRGWVAGGQAGEMAYMGRPDRVAHTCAPTATLGTMRSMVVVASSYFSGDLPEAIRADPARGLIASYAWGPDYHRWMGERLAALAEWLVGAVGAPVASRVWVDHGPLLERDAAVRAGLGFVGRNTMLIHPRWGAWLFLGALLTEAELPPAPPAAPAARGTCGACTRCLVSCPTAAFPKPYVLDARRCISYLTIELAGPIPPDLRPGLGNRVFGCDICNEVCPYNRQQARRSGAPAPDLEVAAPYLADLAALDEAAFERRFGATPVARPGRTRLRRNVAVALGNWAATGDAGALGPLEGLLGDGEGLVRAHAAWGLGRAKGSDAARALLDRALRRETEPEVVAEIGAALAAG
jgi:epoxyqueuosine reductase